MTQFAVDWVACGRLRKDSVLQEVVDLLGHPCQLPLIEPAGRVSLGGDEVLTELEPVLRKPVELPLPRLTAA